MSQDVTNSSPVAVSVPTTLSYYTARDTASLDWQQRDGGIELYLSPPPRGRLIAQANFHLAIWSLFLFVTVLVIALITWAAVPPSLMLASLAPIVILIFLLRSAWVRRCEILAAAHRNTIIRISKGALLIHSPHPPDARDLAIHLNQIRELCALSMDCGLRISIENIWGILYEIRLKCDRSLAQRLELDLRHHIALSQLPNVLPA